MARVTTFNEILALTVATLNAQGICGGNVNTRIIHAPGDDELPFCCVFRAESESQKITNGPTYSKTDTLAIHYVDKDVSDTACVDKINAACDAIEEALACDPVWASPLATGFSHKGFKAQMDARESSKGNTFVYGALINIPVTYTAHRTMRKPTPEVTLTEIEHNLHTDGVDRLTAVIELQDPET